MASVVLGGFGRILSIFLHVDQLTAVDGLQNHSEAFGQLLVGRADLIEGGRIDKRPSGGVSVIGRAGPTRPQLFHL